LFSWRTTSDRLCQLGLGVAVGTKVEVFLEPFVSIPISIDPFGLEVTTQSTLLLGDDYGKLEGRDILPLTASHTPLIQHEEPREDVHFH